MGVRQYLYSKPVVVLAFGVYTASLVFLIMPQVLYHIGVPMHSMFTGGVLSSAIIGMIVVFGFWSNEHAYRSALKSFIISKARSALRSPGFLPVYMLAVMGMFAHPFYNQVAIKVTVVTALVCAVFLSMASSFRYPRDTTPLYRWTVTSDLNESEKEYILTDIGLHVNGLIWRTFQWKRYQGFTTADDVIYLYPTVKIFTARRQVPFDSDEEKAAAEEIIADHLPRLGSEGEQPR